MTVPEFIPDRTALLLMDLQNFTLAMLDDPAELLERAQHARRAALAAGIEVVHVRVAFTEEEHAAVPSHHRVFAALASAGVAGEGTPEVAIHPDVEPEPHEHVVTKTRIGALATTRLDAFLRERCIDTLVLAGLTTSGVVLSTVADAADRDYRLFVLSDACADPDQHLHETLFAKVIPQHAGVVTTAQFAAALDGAS
ncbi:cysteine hydrolase family protein [Amycolatopsis sp. NPDC051903]|uniref:cysteine hydrolase family protein n=1 Tax=Amycolatopsis sp. NPDC051903 TaxID=3363936 RepID=UPI0037AC7181